jgi:hypothetical protein
MIAHVFGIASIALFIFSAVMWVRSAMASRHRPEIDVAKALVQAARMRARMRGVA